MEYNLVATNIRKSFAKAHAVQSLSLKIAPGECLSILGPNGAGKTTTVEMLEGLLAPDAGEITIFGMSYSGNRNKILQGIGVVLQETRLYPKMTVYETLRLFRSFFESGLSIEEVLSAIEMADKTDVRLEKLSGGQRQRVYLGCALINNPKLIFLDEPTTGLDPQSRRALWHLIEGFKKSGKSVLLTTHYMEEAEQLADRVIIMDQGKAIKEGTPKQLIKEVCGDVCLRFAFRSADKAKMGSVLSKLNWVQSARVLEDGTYEIYSDRYLDYLGHLARTCHEAGVALDRLEVKHSNLEDVFLKLTGRGINA
ncbi:MAG: ABC transporter ATP-binding protein [Oligoflexales bacterium]